MPAASGRFLTCLHTARANPDREQTSDKRRKMSEVVATALPEQSLLHNRIAAGDFVDCYRVRCVTSPRAAARIITGFPGWVNALLLVRRLVTTPFGLSNNGPPAADKVGPFPVEIATEHELIAGFDDKHLDFRVSVMCQEGQVFLATWVHPHNVGGRIYLGAIMPFHILIVRDGLQRVANAAR